MSNEGSNLAKVVVITGAGGALGNALVTGFAKGGVSGVVVADVDETAVHQAARLVSDLGVPVEEAVTDVRLEQDVANMVETAIRAFGRLDVLVNNAGVLPPNGRIHNQQAADWQRCFEVNLMGAVHGITFAVPAMKSQGGGAIINTGSVAGSTAWTHSAPYGATKAAVIHLTRIAALEYAKDGIRVNCVCPGAFWSNIHEGLPESVKDTLDQRHPLGLGSAEDLVGAFLYLASDEARWTTGSVMVVDGGYSLP